MAKKKVKSNWTIAKGTKVLSRDGNTGRVVMETGLNTVVIVWDKQPHDRFIFSEKDMKKLSVTVARPAQCRFGKPHVIAERANGSTYCIECLKEAV